MSRTYHHGGWKPWVKRPVGVNFASMEPSWWTRAFMTRPKRRRDAATLRRVTLGSVDVDAAVWELGGRKPHLYYW